MERSATDIMQEALVAAVLDAVVAWKAASGGLANALARDLGAVHPNTTFADLPKEVQAAVRDATRATFNRLLKEGYSVAKGAPQTPRPSGGPGGPGDRPRRPDRPRGPGGPPKVEIRPRPRSGKSR